jgi:hypothetical protein
MPECLKGTDMKEVMDLTIDPAMAAAMTITAASTVAEHWLASNPAAAEHLKTGWHIAVEVVVTSPVTLQICFVDPGTGARYPQQRVELTAPLKCKGR